MESLVRHIAHYLSLTAELLAALVIAIGLGRLVWHYLRLQGQRHSHEQYGLLRVQLGSSLALSLELLLAADIMDSAVAPSWEEIGKLGAIILLRTLLNFFLDRELQKMEARLQDVQTGNAQTSKHPT